MFDRYTEKARRVIFFSRYEASQFGSPYIESEHILLGLLREDRTFALRIAPAQMEDIRRQIESVTVIREGISTSVDLPLSDECKHILGYAQEEADLAGHKHIGTIHLAAGILREEGCLAAALLRERGVELKSIREAMKGEAAGAASTGAAGQASAARLQSAVKNVEFRCIDVVVGRAMLPVVPRVGEHVVLKTGGKDVRYRVREVTYSLEQPPGIDPQFPHLLQGVIVQLERLD